MISEKKKITEINQPYVMKQSKEQEKLQAIRDKRRRGLVRRLTALAAVGVMIAVVFTVILVSQWSTIEAKQAEKEELENKLEELQVEEKRLKQEVKNYNDLDYIAEIARRDYYLTKPGETLFKLPETSD
ncbi:FtsB family cell division protein [Bacillus piscicola]|uniref:FtsB family cell division protein n=1 Tax=Bacillus piscicola TaxID=1632684 RepID=UPI001F0897A4|nr:septum formation initiator family protein [Bacillus piscicola]